MSQWDGTMPQDSQETVVVPREPTREQRLAMQRALLDNYPVVHDGEVCTNGNMLDAIYSAALEAAPVSPDSDLLKEAVKLLRCVDRTFSDILDENGFHPTQLRRVRRFLSKVEERGHD